MPGPSAAERVSPAMAAAIRAARKAKGLTGQQVADALGLSLRTWARIEKSKAPLSVNRYDALVALIGPLGGTAPSAAGAVNFAAAILSICDAPGDPQRRIDAIRSIVRAQEKA